MLELKQKFSGCHIFSFCNECLRFTRCVCQIFASKKFQVNSGSSHFVRNHIASACGEFVSSFFRIPGDMSLDAMQGMYRFQFQMVGCRWSADHVPRRRSGGGTRRPRQRRFHSEVRRRPQDDMVQETSNAGVGGSQFSTPCLPRSCEAGSAFASLSVGSSPRRTWRFEWLRGDVVADQLEGVQTHCTNGPVVFS